MCQDVFIAKLVKRKFNWITQSDYRSVSCIIGGELRVTGKKSIVALDESREDCNIFIIKLHSFNK